MPDVAAPTLSSVVRQKPLRSHRSLTTQVARILPRWILRIVLWAIILGMLVPYVFMVTTSFKPGTYPTAIPPQWIFEPTFDHYKSVWTGTQSSGSDAFVYLILHSTVAAVSSTILAILIGLPAAYALSRIRFKGRRILALWILSTIMMPPVVTAIPLFVLAGQLHLMDTYPALVIPYTAGSLPMVIWLLRSTILQLPAEIEDAALVDGASRFGILIRIVIPLSVSGIATAAMLVLIGCWNEFLFAVSLTRANVMTAPVGVTRYQGQFGTDWGNITAAASIIILPILVMALVLRRRLVAGLTSGAVK